MPSDQDIDANGISSWAAEVAEYELSDSSFRSLTRLMRTACKFIESLTEARVAASNHIESLSLRIKELEAQVAALAPPKSAGPVIGSKWWDDCTPGEQQSIRDMLDGKES